MYHSGDQEAKEKGNACGTGFFINYFIKLGVYCFWEVKLLPIFSPRKVYPERS